MKTAIYTLTLLCVLIGLGACNGVSYNPNAANVSASDSVNSYRWEQQREWNPPGWRARR